MKIEKIFTFYSEYPIERIADPQTTAFFDIETTGFSAEYNTVYLIGLIYKENNSWRFIQYFAESLEAEAVILEEFFQKLGEFRTLVHFNGDTFDIPFLKKRAAHFGISPEALDIESFDIYKKIKPFRNFLNTKHLKQKDIEKLLGVARDDMMSGGELISVYETYLHTRSPEGLKLLLLHNEDDLKGMPQILPILNIPDFFANSFSFSGVRITEHKNLFGETEKEALICYESSIRLPAVIDGEHGPFRIHCQDHLLCITLPLMECEFKRFYTDYKNYYYLIYEDTAVHKSIGEFIDKDARKKATAKTCYTKVQGTFFPLPAPDPACIIKPDYASKQCYHSWDEDFFSSETALQTFLPNLLALLIRSR